MNTTSVKIAVIIEKEVADRAMDATLGYVGHVANISEELGLQNIASD